MYYKSQGSRNQWYIISLGMLRDPLHVNLSGEFRQKSLCLPPPPPERAAYTTPDGYFEDN